MKHLFFFCLLVCASRAGFGQVVNPTIIQQDTDIAIQHTDVYYNPYAPPDPSVKREQLSNQAVALRDSNGLNTLYPGYQPMVHTIGEAHDTSLKDWQPHGTPLGQYAGWQRLFQAKRKHNGTPSDIIAGDTVRGSRVIISKNEDVDFRASGRIKLKSGFHVKPGAFFHAYTEPRWDTTVFSDEFDDTAKFRNQWHVSNGFGGNYYNSGASCVYDSNVRLVTDLDAHDGHAVDLIMREDTVDTCRCNVLWGPTVDSCGNFPNGDVAKFVFSSGLIRSCPFPFQQRVHSPFHSAYAHQPYGKYEIREKIPHIKHHTNNWGFSFNYGFEYDMNETQFSGDQSTMVPNWGHQLQHGSFHGHFANLSGTEIFYSNEPGWNLVNSPTSIVIDNVPYQVTYLAGHGHDTVKEYDDIWNQRWPDSLFSRTGPITFYYAANSYCTADSLPWRVDTDAFGKRRIFSGGYHVLPPHDTLRFTKAYQPTSVLLRGYDYLGAPDSQISYACHWEHTLNDPDTLKGILYLDQPMDPIEPDSGNEPYGYVRNDGGYPEPYIAFNGSDTAGGYDYHTFAMEWLPNEVRYLFDSNVVVRFPDRMIPRGDPHFDWVATMPRAMSGVYPAQFDIDYDASDPFGIDSSHNSWGGNNSITYVERKYFEHAASIPGWPGFEDVEIPPGSGHWHHAAHHMIDYVKIWDVPKSMYISNLPY